MLSIYYITLVEDVDGLECLITFDSVFMKNGGGFLQTIKSWSFFYFFK